jgi:hypothetical protein
MLVPNQSHGIPEETLQVARAAFPKGNALGLELRDAGFHYSVLSEFRQRLVTQEKTHLLLERILARCLEKGC